MKVGNNQSSSCFTRAAITFFFDQVFYAMDQFVYEACQTKGNTISIKIYSGFSTVISVKTFISLPQVCKILGLNDNRCLTTFEKKELSSVWFEAVSRKYMVPFPSAINQLPLWSIV
jgi:hypothetical protein